MTYHRCLRDLVGTTTTIYKTFETLCFINHITPSPYYFIFRREYDTIVSLRNLINKICIYKDTGFTSDIPIIHENNVLKIIDLIRICKKYLNQYRESSIQQIEFIECVHKITSKLFKIITRETGYNMVFQYGVYSENISNQINNNIILDDSDFNDLIETMNLPIIDYIQISQFTYLCLVFETDLMNTHNNNFNNNNMIIDIHTTTLNNIFERNNPNIQKELQVETYNDYSNATEKTTLKLTPIYQWKQTIFNKKYKNKHYNVYYNKMSTNSHIL
jgi:hypothetical protein